MKCWCNCFATLLVLFFLTNEINAQDTTCIYGSVFEKFPESKPLDFYCLDANYGLVLGKKKSKNPFKFVFLDSNLIVKSQVDLSFPSNSFVNSLVVDNKPYLFFSKTNAEGQQELMVQMVNSNGQLANPYVLTSFKNIGGYKVNFKLAVSKNSKKVVLLVEHPYEKQKHEKFTLILFDERLKLIQIVNKTLDVLYKHKRINFPVVSDDGSVYVIKKHFDKKTQYYIFHLKGSDVEEAKIGLRSRDVVSLRYLANDKGELNVFGFFKSPIHLNYEGVFSMRFNNSVHPEFKKEVFLTEKTVGAFKSKKEIKTKGFGLDNFKINKLLTDTSGNFFLVAGHLFRSQLKIGSEHFRKGLVAVKFSKTGNFIWSSPFVYNQYELFSKQGSWASFIPFVDDKELNIIYNSINYKLKKPEQMHANTFIKTNRIGFDKLGMPIDKKIDKIYGFKGGKMGLIPDLLAKNGKNIFLLFQNEQKTESRVVRVNLY